MNTARRLLLCLCACALLFAIGQGADAYMSIRVPNGNPGQALAVRWDLNNVALRPNIANRRVLYEIDDKGTVDAANFIGPINEFEAIQNSFAVWRNIHESEIDFEFAGATTNAVTSATDNRNVLRWVDANISAGVFAVTITTFNTTTGQITDADMQLNDRDFTWDVLGPTGTQGQIGRAMIEQVVTHEIGHFIGLDHPANSASTLYFTTGAGLINQVSLEVDDRAPIIQSYAHPTNTADLGTVQGSVTSSGNGVFGVQVVLIDVSTGRNVIGHVTEGTPGPFTLGNFEIVNVPPGNYMAFALASVPSVLGTYYSSSFTNFYPILHGVPVGTVGPPTLVKVAAGATTSGVTIALPAASQNPHEPDSGTSNATSIGNGDATVSTISPATDEDWYQFTTTQASQQVRIRVLSDAFGFPLNPTLTLYDTNGTTVLVSPEFGDPAYVASANDRDSTAYDASGPDFDAEIVRVMATPGTYFFKVASRIGVSTGRYVLMLELEGVDTTADTTVSGISASAAGIAANSGGNFTVTVTPRNAFSRDLNAPSTYTVELLDVTGTPAVLQTITNGTTPFNFTVTAQTTAQLVRYGARIAGQEIAATVEVSHYGAISTTNSRIVLLESTLNANGYDRIPLVIEVRDGGNNLRPDATQAVTVSTTTGTLDNGSVQGASNVAAVLDAASGVWRIELVAPTSVGTATVTAFVNAVQIDSKQFTILPRATGTGSQPPTNGGGGGDDDDGGGCATSHAGPAGLLVLALLAWRARRRRVALTSQCMAR